MCRRVPSSKSTDCGSDEDRGEEGGAEDLFAEASDGSDDDDDDDIPDDDDDDDEEEEERLWKLQLKQQREAKREQRRKKRAKEEEEKAKGIKAQTVSMMMLRPPGPFLSRSPGSRFKFDEAELVPCAGVPLGSCARARA